MLIDIFARRYSAVPLQDTFEQRDSRLLVQAFRILSEDVCPYYRNGKEDSHAITFWTNLHDRLSRELGVEELSPRWFSLSSGIFRTHEHTMVDVCKNWMMRPVAGSADEHVKERLSLIEWAFGSGATKSLQ